MTRDITIRTVLNGWEVQVNCQTLVYTERAKLIADFTEYLIDPEKVEKRILEKEAVNQKFTMGPLSMADCANTYAPQPDRAVVDNLVERALAGRPR